MGKGFDSGHESWMISKGRDPAEDFSPGPFPKPFPPRTSGQQVGTYKLGQPGARHSISLREVKVGKMRIGVVDQYGMVNRIWALDSDEVIEVSFGNRSIFNDEGIATISLRVLK